jgi:tripartite-type tricarboxylate transporter receptor subunit TctC
MTNLTLPRRKFLHLAAGAAALPAVSRIARAQTYPSRSVRIVAGFAPGGQADLYARLIGQSLSQRFGRPFVVENRVGAAGSLAAESVAKAAPDGHTLLLTTAVDAWNTAVYDNLRFNYLRDLAPVASIAHGMDVLVVNPLFPAKSVPELIAYSKIDKIRLGSGGAGGKTVAVVGEPPKRVAINEWDSLEQAQAFFNSAAFKNLAPQRDKAQKQIRNYAVEATN